MNNKSKIKNTLKERISSLYLILKKDYTDSNTLESKNANKLEVKYSLFLSKSLELCLHALNHLMKNNVNDLENSNKQIYIDIYHEELDVIIDKITYDTDVYIGYNLQVQDIDSIMQKTKEVINDITKRVNEKGLGQRAIHIFSLMPKDITYNISKSIKPELLLSEQYVDLFDNKDRFINSLQQNGADYIASGIVGIVMLAGGGGTRLKNSIDDILKNVNISTINCNVDGNVSNNIDNIVTSHSISEDQKWTIEQLSKSDLLSKLNSDVSKLVVPMTVMANKSPICENLEALSSIARDFNPLLHVVIVVGPTTKGPIINLLKDNNNFGLKKLVVMEQDEYPFVREDTGRIAEQRDGSYMTGANGGGGVLLALNKSVLKDCYGNIVFEGTAIEWFRNSGVSDIIMAQTDDAKDKQVYLGLAGAKHLANKREKNSLVVLGSEYPKLYKVTSKNGTSEIDFDFKIGSLWQWHNPEGKLVKYGITEYGELSKEQKDIMKSVFEGLSSGRIIGSSGSYVLGVNIIHEIIEKSLLNLHFQPGKKEVCKDGSRMTVTKFEFFIPDIVEIAAALNYKLIVAMLRNTSNIHGKLANMTIDSLPVKDVYKLALAQAPKLYKDKSILKQMGISIEQEVMVEVSNLVNWGKIGNGIEIKDMAKVYFGGSYEKECNINIGNKVIFKDSVKVYIGGDCPIFIEDYVCFEGDGEIHIKSYGKEPVRIKAKSVFTPCLGEVIYISC